MTTARLPNAEYADAPKHKVLGYLLCETHTDGRGKARFFSGYGFSAANWHTLAAALVRHAIEHAVAETVETPFGIRYVVEGSLPSPDGRSPQVRSVWFVDSDGEAPRLVTAYPVKRR